MKVLTEEIRSKDGLLQIPETSHGFCTDTPSYAGGIPVRTWFAEGEPGDYQIHLRLKAKKHVSECFIFAGRKSLVWKGSLKAGQELERNFVTNVSKIIPRYHEETMEMKYICLSMAAENLEDIEILGIASELVVDNPLKHLWLCGDSTVTDQAADLPYNPGACYSAWGQTLPAFLAEGYVVSNHAHCGLTTESFRLEGHYRIVCGLVRPGDFVFFQFGHNDQKLTHLLPDTGYRENLIRYIEEIRNLEANPVLVTPLARNTWKPEGGYNDLLEEYGDMVARIGTEYRVPVLDLHKKSADLFCRQGFEAAKGWFHPGDLTHTNEYGAYKMAGFIAEELRSTGMDEKYGILNRETHGDWNPPEFLWESLKEGMKTGPKTDQQREKFDSMEKSVENLVKIIEEAKSGR